MRRQYGGYFKGHRGASQLRARLMEHEERDAVLEVLLNWREDEPALRVPVTAVKPAALKARLPKPVRLPERHQAA